MLLHCTVRCCSSLLCYPLSERKVFHLSRSSPHLSLSTESFIKRSFSLSLSLSLQHTHIHIHTCKWMHLLNHSWGRNSIGLLVTCNIVRIVLVLCFSLYINVIHTYMHKHTCRHCRVRESDEWAQADKSFMGRWENLIWHAMFDLLRILRFLFHFPYALLLPSVLMLISFFKIFFFFSPIGGKTVKSLKWWAYATCVHVFVCVSLLFARTQTLCWCTTWMYRRWTTAGSHAALSSAPSTPTGKSGQSGARRSSLDNSSPCVSSLCISTDTTFLLLSSTQVFSPRAFTKFGSAANPGSVSFHLSCSSNTGKDAEEPRQAWKWISRQLVWNI